MIKTIRMMGRDYPIVGEPNLLSDKEASGILYRRQCRIALDPADAAVSQGETLLHEIIESIKGDLQISMEHPDLLRLSEGIFAVLRDNAEVARHIMAGRRIVPKP